MGALRFPGFGERLERAMRAAGYVNGDGKLDVPGFIEQFGFDPRNFYPWLRGKRTPELPTLTRLAEILGVPRSWLLLGDGPEPDGLKPARRRRTPLPIAGGSDACVPPAPGTPPVAAQTPWRDRTAAYRTRLRDWWYAPRPWSPTLAAYA